MDILQPISSHEACQKREWYQTLHLRHAVPERIVGGYNATADNAVAADEDSEAEYEDDENARLLDVCIDGDVEDMGRSSIANYEQQKWT